VDPIDLNSFTIVLIEPILCKNVFENKTFQKAVIRFV
jgi:hypothetical protein